MIFRSTYFLYLIIDYVRENRNEKVFPEQDSKIFCGVFHGIVSEQRCQNVSVIVGVENILSDQEYTHIRKNGRQSSRILCLEYCVKASNSIEGFPAVSFYVIHDDLYDFGSDIVVINLYIFLINVFLPGWMRFVQQIQSVISGRIR